LSTRSKTTALETARKSLGMDDGMPPKLSRAQVLVLRFGDRSQLRCRHCGGELFLHESYPKQQDPPT